MAVKALTNVTVTYDGDSLEEHLTQASIEAIIAEIDTTVLSSAAGEKSPDWGTGPFQWADFGVVRSTVTLAPMRSARQARSRRSLWC